MPKIATAWLSVLFMSVVPLAHAQQGAATGATKDLPSAEDLKAFTDARVNLVKMALKLTPEQEKYWPAIEEAIRARAAARSSRLESLASKAKGAHDFTPTEILKERAEGLSQRSANLTKLADAWQPLYQTLDNSQKMRLRFVASYVFREIRDEVASRRSDNDDDSDY